MFNLFKKKEKIENPVEITISGINPQTENEFLFYNFVEFQFAPHLEKWYRQAKSNGIVFKTQYENAILEKMKTGEFKNPHNFPEYFENKFDFIAIDFETANKNRVSACALGLVFIKNDRIAYQTSFHIKPPNGENFESRNIEIHRITAEDVDYAMTFDELWELELSNYFNDSLVIFHNASMDLSVLKNLFAHYSITNYDIEYLDTMRIAEKLGIPKKLEELTTRFDVEFENNHDPEKDAKACAMIFGELIEQYPNYKELIGNLNHNEQKQKIERKQESAEIKNENLDIIQTYSMTKEEVEKIEIQGKGFVFTGDITTDRNVAKDFIVDNGGVIKSGVTSKVDFVIIGSDFGWSKIQKVQNLNENKNCQIKILSNRNFEQLCEKYAT
ncbi:exonuclease domain-containing protein [Formosa sp. PL04]|uniref:exonuclease domain-containing protein n=1 Tax=Formosa sp. PL04 TaxID=3081755 RepID=UPI002982464B|nr:exonuclease domain-containing protein [Formosa sp. PL04]MDW5288558.1 exonuclease domain-containing protein [Formosa sp. PL04]